MDRLKNRKVLLAGIIIVLAVFLTIFTVNFIFGATINGTAKNGQRLVLVYSTSRSGAKTTFDWTLYVQRTNTKFNTYNTNVTAKVTIGGTTKSFKNKTYDIRNLAVNAKRKICSGTHTVTQTNGAEKAVTIKASVPTGSTTVGTMSLSKSITLPYYAINKTVSGSVVWSDDSNRDGKRPGSVSVTLYRSGSGVTSVATGGAFSFASQPTYNTSGSAYSYTVNGSDVAGYNKSVSGTTITYTHTPARINISGKIVWNDNDDQAEKRPSSVTVSLKNGSSVMASQTVTAANGWAYTFSNQYQYAGGRAIAYSVAQSSVSKYETAVSGYNITNTFATDFEYRAGFSL